MGLAGDVDGGGRAAGKGRRGAEPGEDGGG
jgi:hypothetical protein